MQTLLIIDDEPAIGFAIQQTLSSDSVRVLRAETAEAALTVVTDEHPDVVLLDVRLGGDSGLQVFKDLRAIDPEAIVIFITGFGTAELTIEAMKLGAYDYLVKPLDLPHLQEVVAQALKIRQRMSQPMVNGKSTAITDEADHLVGSGASMRAICKQIGRISPQDVNVLIRGESGTGKELVARALHNYSRRSDKPMLAINCAALSETLLESELFGHERGAFTGADRRRIGKFEHADGGTIFLDEIGDMSLSTQAKILRLLQDGSFERVGGNDTFRTNVRLIAATHRNLESMIATGAFRLDLFYRLRGVSLTVPPLRERLEDIPELAHYFMFRLNQELGLSVTSIDATALELLRQYRWPGNVRELQGVIRESLIRSVGSTLLPEFLPEHILSADNADLVPPTESNVIEGELNWESLSNMVKQEIERGSAGVYRRVLLLFDQLVVNAAINRAGGNQAAAAEILGLSRPTLRSKIRQIVTLRKGLDQTPRTNILQ